MVSCLEVHNFTILKILYKTIDISYVMLFAHAKFYCHLTPGYVPENTMHFCDDLGLSPATSSPANGLG